MSGLQETLDSAEKTFNATVENLVAVLAGIEGEGREERTTQQEISEVIQVKEEKESEEHEEAHEDEREEEEDSAEEIDQYYLFETFVHPGLMLGLSFLHRGGSMTNSASITELGNFVEVVPNPFPPYANNAFILGRHSLCSWS